MNQEPNKERGWFYRNCANIVTMLRFPICFVLLWVVIYHREWTSLILLLVTGACFTDWLDGCLAKGLKITSRFGAAADRLGDKLLLGIMFLFLILDGRIHITLKIITVPMAVLETMLLLIWFMGVKRKMDVATVKSTGKYGPGQIKMGLMSAGILFCLVNLTVEESWGPGYNLYATTLINIMFAISLFFAVKSYIAHKAKYRLQSSQLSAK